MSTSPLLISSCTPPHTHNVPRALQDTDDERNTPVIYPKVAGFLNFLG
ncbi:hypothetical protein HMPREF0742_01229 [Rothia aeria F0184]|uniref:Uncharacterized protein n=1 Tax=Rothia aeria F0184 TaxID=888019 RepID=U7V3C4_9MICC|nr:hypothetical protein HMPREF0742_01229 [Rothia aeria F0184]